MLGLTPRIIRHFRFTNSAPRKLLSVLESGHHHHQARNMSSTPRYSADYLKTKIEQNLDAEFVDIEDQSNCNCGMKFQAVIVSPKFEGKPLLQRQRLVNEVLTEEMKHIHAFTMKTLAPSQWKDSISKD